jgi:TP901 family phage tail tape measure protein
MAFTISYNIRAIDQFTKTAAKISTSATNIDKTMRMAAKGSNVAARSFDKLQNNSSAASVATTTLNASTKKTTRRMDEASRAAKKMSRANESAARTERDLAKATKKAEQAFKKKVAMMKTVGRGMEQTGRFITTRLALPMIGVGAAAIKMTMDFNKGLANVGTLIPGQTEKLRDFRKEILDLSIDTGTGANIMTEGLYQVISAIGDTGDTMKVLDISARAAKAGVAETRDSVNLLTKVSSAYGDTSAKMVQKVSDLSFLAVKLGVTTFPELANSMGKISATADTMSVSVEELFADTSALTKVMGDTSQAATAMDSVLRGLLQGNKELDRVIKKLGAKSGKELIEMSGGLTQALSALKEEVDGDEVAFAKLFGRAEAQKGALLLTGSLAGAAADNMKAMKNAVGATDAAYREQTEGINASGHSWDQTKARVFKLAITLGDKLLPAFNKFLDRIEPIITHLSDVDGPALDAAIAFGEFAIKAGLLFSALGKIMRLSAGFESFISTASTDMLGFSRNSDAAAAGVDKVSGKMSKMQKGVAVLGAAAMGYSLGQLAQQAVIDPAVSESERRTTTLGNRAVEIERGIDEMNLEQMKKARGELEKRQDKLGIFDWVANNDEFNRTMQDSSKALGRLDRAIKLTEEAYKRQKAASIADMEKKKPTEGVAQKGLNVPSMEAQKMELELTLKAENGTEVTDVKTKSKNSYAKVNTGKNAPQ